MVTTPEQSILSEALISVGFVTVLAMIGLSFLRAARLSMLAGLLALVVGSVGVLLAQADQERYDRAVQGYMATTYGLKLSETEARSMADGATVTVKGRVEKTERLRFISPDRPNPILVKVTKSGASGDTVPPKSR